MMVKESLKQKQDQESCIYRTSLSEFENYSYEDSIRNITFALNGLKILKTKKLERNISDIQLEMILSQCLLNADQAEYFREWAKERSNTVLSSTIIEPGDEEEPPVNFNKTICDEVDAGAMEVLKIPSEEANVTL